MKDDRIIVAEDLIEQHAELLERVDEIPPDRLSEHMTHMFSAVSLRLQVLMCERLEEIAAILKRKRGSSS